MSKYIELIDKYRIVQSKDTDYNPPSYDWVDNTGEIVRCNGGEQMSILIKGMEMPTDCALMLKIFPDGRVGVPVHLNWCGTMVVNDAEAVPVPPHGDLIDYDFCMENYELLHDDDGNPVYAVRMRDINIAPTIIPAEEGE